MQGKLLIHNSDIIELGCGTGVVSIVGTVQSFTQNNVKSLLLTDGNPQAIQLTRLNINNMFPNSSQHKSSIQTSHHVTTPTAATTATISDSDTPSCIPVLNLINTSSSSTKVNCTEYLWSRSAHVASSLCTHFNNNQPYDIVVGCELMYYRTDIELLLANVIHLTSNNTNTSTSTNDLRNNPKGLFIHSHVFRGDFHQETQLKTVFRRYNWLTLSIPIYTFVSSEELSQHPEWYAVIVLVSGPELYIHQLITQYKDLGWSLFTSCNQARSDNYVE